jgi:hypothetical protein
MNEPKTLNSRFWVAKNSRRYCPKLAYYFDNHEDLAQRYCNRYSQETTESYAIELWQELS